MKPRIGIVAGATANNEHGFTAQLSESYLNSVRVAGGAPLMLPTTQDAEILDAMLDAVDGVILPGGEDHPTALYGESPHVMTAEMTGPRRGFDVFVCRRAVERGIPALGICLGCQTINIALGGSLQQDIVTELPESPIAHRLRMYPFYTRHEVSVAPDSQLRQIVGAERILTNSAHHQSAKRLGEGLRAVAWADDGVIEAVEADDGRFLLGVQWHPEKIAELESGPHRALFEALVEAARGARV